MDLKTVKDLIGFMKDTDIVELEWSKDGIRIVRNMSGSTRSAKTMESGASASSAPEQKEKPTVKITSPLVGTFYRSPSPESPPFVQVGDRVTKGQCLCVIEAMKLMNEIESHVDGVVSAILKQDGERVGYGDPLFIIEEV